MFFTGTKQEGSYMSTYVTFMKTECREASEYMTLATYVRGLYILPPHAYHKYKPDARNFYYLESNTVRTY